MIGAQLKSVDADVATSPLGVFAIERFAEAEYVRDQGFTIPADTRVRAILEGSFGPHLPDPGGPHDVVVEFSAEKAHLVASREWHPTQQVARLRNGRVRLSFRAPSIAPLVSWILEWGPQARAISPDLLVEQVKLELEQALAQY